MNNAPLSPILDAVHPGARVHHGFLSQFRAVTDQAPNASMNIKYVLSVLPQVLADTVSQCSCTEQQSLHM